MAELAQAQSEAAARLEAMIGMLGDRQSQLQTAVNERLDSVSHRLGDSLQKTTQNTTENLQKLNERLAVIDSAQKNITDLATQVTSLQSVLANKQSRGAFGQGRMEIDHPGLPAEGLLCVPAHAVEPHPAGLLRVHARQAPAGDRRQISARRRHRLPRGQDRRRAQAGGPRVRTDIGKHVADIAEKYLIPGETQELALMFVPSESVYAELHDGFDDMVQKAFRAKVVIVSPSLLMLAIALVQQIQKDARMREAADQIRDEVGASGEGRRPAGRSRPQAARPFQPVQRRHPADRSSRSRRSKSRGERIQQVEFGDDAPSAPNVIAGADARKLEAGE